MTLTAKPSRLARLPGCGRADIAPAAAVGKRAEPMRGGLLLGLFKPGNARD